MRHKPRGAKPSRRDPPRSGRRSHTPDTTILFGIHAVEAALRNPRREITRILATENAAKRLSPLISQRNLTVEPALPRDLDRLLGSDTVHQGVAVEVAPLQTASLDDIDEMGLLIVLDQVTDPHNVGAVLRSGAAFGAAGLMMTERHSPPLTGTLAKSASGALDVVPIVLVKNLAQALAELGERGFQRVGLAEEGSETLESIGLQLPLALVFGAEGEGLRRLTREHCDQLCRIDTAPEFGSLNISNAAAVTLHWASLKTRG